jgi:hypothetical protein
MKLGAISLPAAIGAFTCFTFYVVIGNIYFTYANHSFAEWLTAVLMTVVVILGIVAAITGGIGKRRDEQPRIAVVGFGMGIGAIAAGALFLFINTI